MSSLHHSLASPRDCLCPGPTHTYPGCAGGIPNRGPRARVWTTGPGHFTRRKKKGESSGIGPFAELATPTFFAGATFFF